MFTIVFHSIVYQQYHVVCIRVMTIKQKCLGYKVQNTEENIIVYLRKRWKYIPETFESRVPSLIRLFRRVFSSDVTVLLSSESTCLKSYLQFLFISKYFIDYYDIQAIENSTILGFIIKLQLLRYFYTQIISSNH